MVYIVAIILMIIIVTILTILQRYSNNSLVSCGTNSKTEDCPCNPLQKTLCKVTDVIRS